MRAEPHRTEMLESPSVGQEHGGLTPKSSAAPNSAHSDATTARDGACGEGTMQQAVSRQRSKPPKQSTVFRLVVHACQLWLQPLKAGWMPQRNADYLLISAPQKSGHRIHDRLYRRHLSVP